ncbi:DUF4126 family protein [Mucilaginibacter glaciei]|uniref:DUF4126 family protein n=1 Tax=Mucilaginibacter glaciei TaxID=2772109 RepID=A0A926NRQ7_9SPHI|nr:DUF4126 family protein [Mucilaginibacter glaciei]MBD1392700.1 DUF4126 family protein [Mucilaginibacter glaciei]
MKNSSIFLQTIGLGAVAGMRATMAPAVASHYLSNHPDPALSRSSLRFIQLPVTAIVTKLLSVAEIAGDKIPNGPDRIILPQLLARVASGAFVGATIFKANRKSVFEGMILGGVSALAATYASFYARKYADKLPFLKEPFSGAVEDAVALGTGISILKA